MTIGLQDLGIAITGDIADLQRNLAAAGTGVDNFGKKTQGALRGVTAEAKQTDDALSRLSNGIKSAFVGSSVAVGLITMKNAMVSMTGAMVDAQVQLDRLNNGFRFGAGGVEAGAKEMAFVRGEVDRLGLSLGSTASQYMKMVAASRGNAMAGEKTRQLFTSIAEASVVMGMGQEQSERAMMAVVQMMSKGKVMAEELRGQLGEHLPGAFSIAARAMGVTEVQLNKMMETGSVLSDDFLPRFAEQLRKELAGSVEQSTLSMQANLNRLSTAWMDFKQQLAQGGVGSAIASQTKTLATELTILGDVLESSRQRGDGFWMTMANVSGAAAGRVAFQVLQDSANGANAALNWMTGGVLNLNTSLDLVPDNLKPVAQQMELTGQKVKQAEAEYAALSARLAQAPDNIYIKSELGNLARYIATLRVAQDEQRKMMGMSSTPGPAGAVPSGDTLLARAQRADYDKRKALRDETLKKYATDGEKFEAEAKRLKEALGDLYSPDLEKRIREHYIKPKKAAKEATDEFAKVLNRVTAKDSGLDPSFYKDLNTLYQGWQKGRIGIDEYRAAVESLIASQKFATDAAREHAEAMNIEERFMTIVRDKQAKWDDEKAKANEYGARMMESIRAETELLSLNTTEREISIAMRDLERAGVIEGTAAYELYAEAIKKAIVDREQARQMKDFWEEVNTTAENVFVDLAMNGEDAFKRIGQSIKREVIQMLYEMTVKKWIIQVSGQTSAAGGGGNSWIDMAVKAYDAYTGGGAGGAGAAAASAASTYSLASGTQSVGVAAGAKGVTGLSAGAKGASGLSATATTPSAGAAASGSTAASSMGAYMSYAAWIAAAVMIAENLYSKGYNRAALGVGGSQQYRFGRTTFNTDPNISKSWMDKGILNLEAKNQRNLQDAVGMSEKWADIFSGTTRMATLIGRKLSDYGYMANFQGGDVSVGGYAKYKGGLFRSNKTVDVKVNEQSAAEVESLMRSIQAGSKSMAAAMGLNAAAIDNYTGKLKVNMKGADTAAEQSERMAKAMDNLQYSMLKAASGGKLAKEEFERMTAQARADMESVGISASGMADIIAQGMMGRMSQSQVGEALSEMVIGGIYNMIVSPFASQIAQAFMSQIIQPMVVAVTTGGSVSAAVSQASMDSVMATANRAINQLGMLLENPEFKAGMNRLMAGLNSLAGASVRPAASIRSYGSAVSASGTAAKAAADEARRAAQAIKDTWSGITDSILEEMGRIRRAILGETPAGSAYAQAQFAIATAQARAGDQRAAERLPDLSQALLDLAETTAASAGDLRAVQGSTLASLAQTRRILGTKFGLALPAFDVGTNYVPRDMVAQIHKGEAIVPAAYNPAAGGIGGNAELLAEMRAMRAELADLKRSNLVAAGSATRLERIMETATNGGNVTRVQVVA